MVLSNDALMALLKALTRNEWCALVTTQNLLFFLLNIHISLDNEKGGHIKVHLLSSLSFSSLLFLNKEGCFLISQYTFILVLVFGMGSTYMRDGNLLQCRIYQSFEKSCYVCVNFFKFKYLFGLNLCFCPFFSSSG